jgi:hypothetical protein
MSFLKIPTTLMRGVGRKILALFLLAGILPMAITASLAYFEVQRSMEDEVGRTLRANAKDYGFDLFAQLRLAATAADRIAQLLNDGGAAALSEHDYLLSSFDSLWVIDSFGSATPIIGAIDTAISADALAKGVERSTKSGLIVSKNGTGHQLTMLRRVGAENILALGLDAADIWGAEED